MSSFSLHERQCCTSWYSDCRRAFRDWEYSSHGLARKVLGPKSNRTCVGHSRQTFAARHHPTTAIDTTRGMGRDPLTAHWQRRTQHRKTMQILQRTHGVIIFVTKDWIFLLATWHIDVSVFCAVVLEATFWIKFVLYHLVSFFWKFCSLFPHSYILRTLWKILCWFGALFPNVTLKKASSLNFVHQCINVYWDTYDRNVLPIFHFFITASEYLRSIVRRMTKRRLSQDERNWIFHDKLMQTYLKNIFVMNVIRSFLFFILLIIF